MNLALKDISHNLGRFLLTCLGLSLLLGIVLAMVGIYRGLIVESLGLVRAAGAQVWVVEGRHARALRRSFAASRRHARGRRRAMGRRRGGRRLLSECRGAASRRDHAAAGCRGADRAAGRSAARGRRPADPAQPLRGGRGPRRRACARRADQAWARHLHGGGADPEPRGLGRRSGHLHHAARRAEAAIRPDAGGGAARGRARCPARPERSTR